MLVLLETKMADNKKLAEDLQFDLIVQSPAIGLSGGIVIMWKEDSVSIDEVANTPQGIHAMGCNTCRKDSRWVVHKGNMVNFLSDAIRDMIEGPLYQNNLIAKIDTVYELGIWGFSTISMDLPPSISNM
ncbi:hypothetical protein A4A49_55722, partial [Nicotiana attenuata]